MIGKDNIFTRQNSILKLLFSLILVLITSMFSFDKFLIVFAFTLMYMIVSPTIYIHWLKTLVKLVPFFISLFILGILFRFPFPDQCYLSARIIHILLISIYIVETSSIGSFISWKTDHDSGFWFKLKFLLAATVYFIPILTIKFQDNWKIHKNIINLILISMEDCIKEIHDVEKTILNKVKIHNERVIVIFWSDIYLSLLVIIPGILLFVKIN